MTLTEKGLGNILCNGHHLVSVVLSTKNFYFFTDFNCLVKKLEKCSLKNATNCQLKPRIRSTSSTQVLQMEH